MNSMRWILLLAACTLVPSSFAETRAELHLDWGDSAISPQDNFFLYANGNWQKQNPIPAHYGSWSSFSQLSEKIEEILHQMVIQASQDRQARKGSLTQKVGDFYYSGMDTQEINRQGAKPLNFVFEKINSINSLDDIAPIVAYLHLIGVRVFFDFGAMQDFKDSTQMIAANIQGGLTLPDRDYYLNTDKKFERIRAVFSEYIIQLFQLVGETQTVAEKNAQIIMHIETLLAQASLPQEALRDPHKIYHMMTLEQLNQMTPHFSWTHYLNAMDLTQVKRVNVATPLFLKEMDKQLPKISLAEWKIYLNWHVLAAYADYLSSPFEEAAFKMSQVLKGVETLPPRWKRVLKTENGILGFAIGKLYVEKYASPQAKREVSEMMQNINHVLRQELNKIEWMEPETRKAALKKLELMEKRIGYPSVWWDYSPLNINKGPYVLNVLRGYEFLTRRDLNKIGKPIDKNEWAMSPQTVNAYYDPSMNNINIPIGILSSPFYDPAAPAAVNYGAIGSVIGHEITHAFDDQGAKFDGYGNLNNWWTDKDLKKFQSATQCIETQFSQYKTIGDLSLRGSLVVGEATADLGGLTLAYLAFRASKEYKNAPVVHGLTPDQQFFLGYAHIWANNIRPEQAQLYVLTDPHPPAKYRVNGTLVNMPAFEKAFDIPDILKNKKRCVIW